MAEYNHPEMGKLYEEIKGVVGKIFRKPPTVKLNDTAVDDQPGIIIEELGITIYEGQYEYAFPTLTDWKAVHTANGYIMDEATMINNYPHEPDDVSINERGRGNRTFIIDLLMQRILNQKLSIHFEHRHFERIAKEQKKYEKELRKEATQ